MNGQFDGQYDAPPIEPMYEEVVLPEPDKSERDLAMVTHLVALLTGFIFPLVIYLIKKDESVYLRHHAAESLNLQITVILAFILIIPIAFLTCGIGLLLMFPVAIGSIVVSIIACIAASRGEWYHFPAVIRIVR